jgi:replication initiation protein RepC
MSVTLKHNGLPEQVGRFDLLSMIRDVASALKLTGREVQYLEAAIRRCSELDFEKGSVCAYWARVATIAKKLCCTPRQINSIEKSLEKKKLIFHTTRPNGHRYGIRGATNRITFAAGINLAPMISRYREFAHLKNASEIHEQALAAIRFEIQLCRRKIRDTKDALLVEQSEQALPGGRTSIIYDLDRLNSIHGALLAVLGQIEAEPGLAETSDGQAEASDALEVSGQPSIQTQNITNVCIAPTRRTAKPVSQRQMLL